MLLIFFYSEMAKELPIPLLKESFPAAPNRQLRTFNEEEGGSQKQLAMQGFRV
jgi:hypothetical protein